jgi:hypothetical protein
MIALLRHIVLLYTHHYKTESKLWRLVFQAQLDPMEQSINTFLLNTIPGRDLQIIISIQFFCLKMNNTF